MINKIAKKLKKARLSKKIFYISITTLLTYLLLLLSFFFYIRGRILPNVFVDGLNLGGLKTAEAKSLLENNLQPPEQILVAIDGKDFNINLKDAGFNYDIEKSVISAFYAKRTVINVISLLLNKRLVLDLSYNLDGQNLSDQIDKILAKTNIEPIYPSLNIKGGQINLDKGKEGKIIEKSDLLSALTQNFSKYNFDKISLNTNIISVSLNDEQAANFIERGKKLIGKKLVLKQDDNTLEYTDEKLVKLLDPHSDVNKKAVVSIVNEVASKVNRDPQDSLFIFVPLETTTSTQTSIQGRVQEFIPSKEGVKVVNDLLENKILESLKYFENGGAENVIDIPVDKTQPKITTGDINNLGIKEMIGYGKSKFVGSISSRIHNISLASSRFNGILVAPGEIFSFNKTLGDVSTYTGYKQAYIIKEGQTVLGDGGGVCQVSTTLFRAILNAGLPVVERRAHSYRVGYYEQDSPPGIDATVYDPSPDLKFKNDTPKYILIQTKVDVAAKTLVFELYGTSDGRIATIGKPVVTDVTPPPEDLYIDDPTLPAGEIKQIDYKAWGAKVYFKYTVEKNGEVIIEKTFYSNYQPWQAKFLRGTGSTTS